MLSNKNIIALIPARGGSKSIPKKNIVNLRGFPLIAFSIAAAKMSKHISRIIVSTEAPEIAKVAKSYGAEVPFMRPAEFATDTATDYDVFKHAIDWFEKNESHQPEYWVHLRPTTPLREPELIDKGIEELLKHPEATCLRSGYELRESPHKCFVIENGFFVGLFPEDKRPDYANLPRQSFPKAYQPDGYVDVIKRKTVLEEGVIHGSKILAFITPNTGELDRPEDLDFIKFNLERGNYKIYEYLKNKISTKYRKIKTKIPVPESLRLFKNMQKYEVSDMYQHELPVIWDRTDDFQIYDKWGNKWIDFTSGIFVANVGHCAKKVEHAIAKKLARNLLHSYLFPNDSRIELTKKLCKITGMDKVLLTVTGSEANEAALQTLRRNKKGKILAIKGAFYGSTTACRQLQDSTIDELMSPDRFNPKEIAGVFLQTFRGRDAKFMPYDWVRSWRKWTQKHKIPLGFDEMQSGFARTGKWFGFQNYDIKPDFITVGKALGGGLPISAFLGKKKLMKSAFDLFSTHTGNPVSCAAALAVIETIEKKKLVQMCAERGKWVGKLLRKTFPKNEIYGQGLMWAIYTGDPKITQKVIRKCAEKGLLLVSTHGSAIKIGPPLTIPNQALVEGIGVIKESFREIL